MELVGKQDRMSRRKSSPFPAQILNRRLIAAAGISPALVPGARQIPQKPIPCRLSPHAATMSLWVRQCSDITAKGYGFKNAL
jgi:hypothetical protein